MKSSTFLIGRRGSSTRSTSIVANASPLRARPARFALPLPSLASGAWKRSRWRRCLSLPGAVLLLGRRLLEHPDRLGAAVETAFFKHLFTRFYKETPTFSYWRDRKNGDLEVDIIAELGERLVPFEVKYQGTEITAKKLKGLRLFLEQRDVEHGYVITQRWEDFGVMNLTSALPGKEREKLSARVLRIPAPLACFWLSS
jgi:hypothetical protein